MSKRILMLEKMVEDGTKDPFHWYALALEYAGLNQQDDALRTFSSLRSKTPDYVPMYLMCGTMLLKAGRAEEGRAWLTEGVGVARSKGDTHALSELEEALAGAKAMGSS
ncbi:MAG TPA: tetratricopeptide repeat protein [Polyangiaceae bacterium]|nr:tetratricopeptide repeat protein [Polyangiaceae bacterium]